MLAPNHARDRSEMNDTATIERRASERLGVALPRWVEGAPLIELAVLGTAQIRANKRTAAQARAGKVDFAQRCTVECCAIEERIDRRAERGECAHRPFEIFRLDCSCCLGLGSFECIEEG